ncbi:MAG: hypothetical protein EXQ79_07030 [Acidimicrobiia bacterium]|nr:hypothetical protein [Acidimicrobiia bacterium]
MSEPFIAEAARKHGVSDDAITHAFKNAIQVDEIDEGMTMLVGADRAGNLLEIAFVRFDGEPVIVHAMRARPANRR